MTVFVSYARKDRELVSVLVRDLQRAKRRVWLDQDLTGGQDWWNTVLAQIRACQLFIFVVSADSIRSKACLAELRYASDLSRPIVPVLVSDVAMQLAPELLSRKQLVDYRQRDAGAAVDLMNALILANTDTPLPAPLPEPPTLPASYASALREEIDSDSLTFPQQSSILMELKAHVDDAEERGVVRQLLLDLRRRSDITELIAKETDALLASRPLTPDDVPADLSTAVPEIPTMGSEGAARTPGEGRKGGARQHVPRRLVAIVLGVVAVAAVGSAVAFSRYGGDDLDDLDVGSVASQFRAVVDSGFPGGDVPPEQCPLGDLNFLAGVIDDAVPMSIAPVDPERTGINVETEEPEGPGIFCGFEPGQGLLGLDVFALERSAELGEAELIAIGADHAGGYRNGRIMESERPASEAVAEQRECASFWLTDDVDVAFAVELNGDECTTEASTLALKAALPEMVASLGSFEIPPPPSGTTVAPPGSG